MSVNGLQITFLLAFNNLDEISSCPQLSFCFKLFSTSITASSDNILCKRKTYLVLPEFVNNL